MLWAMLVLAYVAIGAIGYRLAYMDHLDREARAELARLHKSADFIADLADPVDREAWILSKRLVDDEDRSSARFVAGCMFFTWPVFGPLVIFVRLAQRFGRMLTRNDLTPTERAVNVRRAQLAALPGLRKIYADNGQNLPEEPK